MFAPQPRRLWMAHAALLALWAAVVVWRAWVTDDAFITLRTVDNALNGHGLRWNVVERVQAYTHPLWMFATLGVTALIGSAYTAVTWLSVACSVGAALLLIGRVATGVFAACLVTLLMVSSTASLDFSTSGLENPLTHLLIAAFAAVWVKRQTSPGTTLVLALLLTGLVLNRIDSGLLVLPAFVVAAWQRPYRSHVLATVAGFMPFVAWEVFSVIYYGFPFPNTAYAKLATGISAWKLFVQGGHYFGNSLQYDTITLVTIAAALISMMHPSMRPLRPLAIGIALYLGYILRIGGDFMFGRFFSAPFFLSLILLARFPWPATWRVRGPVAAGIVGLRLMVLANPTEISMPHGITDQRLLFSEATRYVTQDEMTVEQRSSAARGLELRRKGRQVVALGMIGMTGYYAGPDVHIVDFFALADPLLARRPADPNSRIGHFRRRIPDGYMQSIRQGRNRIANPRLARYYDDLVLITQGPLWTWERWRAIMRLNFVQRTT
jgi:arabinofuranosyltransferase